MEDTINLQANVTTIGPCTHLNFVECYVAVWLCRILSPVLLLVGVLGNCVSFVVWSRKRMRVTNSSVYLRILAVIDTCVLLIATLRELISHTTDVDIQEINDISCRIHS